MNIAEFFQQSAGKWFSQRTTHDLATPQSTSGKSDLWVDLLTSDDPAVVALCHQAGVEAASVQGAVRIRWTGELGKEEVKQSGSTLMVAIAPTASSSTGTLLSQDSLPPGADPAAIVQAHYSLGADEVLTLTSQHGAMEAEERIWYASPGLRFRTSTVKFADGFSAASFCSEIRMGGVPTSSNQQTAAQA
jgi:hypothetical protein